MEEGTPGRENVYSGIYVNLQSTTPSCALGAMDKDRREYLTTYQREELRKKKKRVELLLEPAEHQVLYRSAQSHGKKLSPFIKSAALAYLNNEYLVPDEDRVRSFELQLRRIGTNINQIARKANREGIDPGVLSNATDLLRELESLLSASFRSPKQKSP